MDLVALHMDFPLVVHVMDSSFRVVVLLADRLEQFLRLLLILVGDVQEVVAQEAHLELVSSNLLVVVSVYSLENCQTFFVVEVLMVEHRPNDVVADSSLVVFLVAYDQFFSGQINRI